MMKYRLGRKATLPKDKKSHANVVLVGEARRFIAAREVPLSQITTIVLLTRVHDKQNSCVSPA